MKITKTKIWCAALLALVALAAAPALAANDVEAFSVTGSVEMAKKGSTVWMPVTKGVLIGSGYTVRTNAGSTAVLRWLSGNAVKLGPLSLFTVNNISGDASGGEKSDIELTQGSVYVRAKKSPGDSAFTLKTPSALAGVRGTEFMAQITDASKTTFAVIEGQITVEAQSITVILDMNFQISVEANQPPGEIFSIPDDLRIQLQVDSREVNQAAMSASQGDLMPPPINTPQTEPPKSEPAKASAQPAGQPNTIGAKAEPAPAQPATQPAAVAASPSTEPAKTEPAIKAPGPAETAAQPAEPAKTEPAKTSPPAKEEPKKVEPVKTEPVKEPPKTAPVKETPKKEPAKTEPKKEDKKPQPAPVKQEPQKPAAKPADDAQAQDLVNYSSDIIDDATLLQDFMDTAIDETLGFDSCY